VIEGSPQKIRHGDLEFVLKDVSRDRESKILKGYVCYVSETMAIEVAMKEGGITWHATVVHGIKENGQCAGVAYSVGESVNWSDAVDLAVMRFMNLVIEAAQDRQALENKATSVPKGLKTPVKKTQKTV
jgi:hypothetical protein